MLFDRFREKKNFQNIKIKRTTSISSVTVNHHVLLFEYVR